MVQYVAILMIYYVVSYAFVGYKNDCHPLEEMPPAAHEYKQPQAIVTTLWIYLLLLSILVPLETGQIFIRLLSLLALDILLAVWLSVY